MKQIKEPMIDLARSTHPTLPFDSLQWHKMGLIREMKVRLFALPQ
jgi:hypothetical protein